LHGVRTNGDQTKISFVENDDLGRKYLKRTKLGSYVVEYVPVQIITSSLEAITLPKHTYIGLTSPVESYGTGSKLGVQTANAVQSQRKPISFEDE
jgi:hypothetical protein